MTEEQIMPPAEPIPATEAPPPVARRGGTPLWLTLVLVAVVAAEPVALHIFLTPSTAPEIGRIAALETAVAGANRRLDTLEAVRANVPAAPILPPPASVPMPAPADTARIEALESRLAALERQPAQAMPDVAGQVAAASAALNARIAALDEEIQKDVAMATARAAFANRLRAASAALEAGQPLGDIPGAGLELTRFATKAPPTEPALRLAFPGYEDAARAASQPSIEGEDALGRAWQRVQGLVTIRQGDKVLIGSKTAALLEDARGKLDAGDLAGAVAMLGKLDPAAQAALAPWLGDAHALLDARAALLALVAKS
jgi:hypothetical protein